MRYRLSFKLSAEKQFKALPKHVIQKLTPLIDALVENPYTHNSKKLKGYFNHFRIRFSEWRVIYTVEEDKLFIEVVRVGHRGKVYAVELDP